MSTINVYLKKEIRLQTLDFKSVQFDYNSSDQISFSGIKLKSEKGRLYVSLAEGEPIPPVLEEFVEEVSIFNWLPGVATREWGVYEHETASAKVFPDSYQGHIHVSVKITSKTMGDALALLSEIEFGSTRPAPGKSYTVPQCGKSRENLEAELRRIQAELECHNEIAKIHEKRLWHQDMQLLEFCNYAFDLGGGWPLCSSAKVAARINAIINQKPVV